MNDKSPGVYANGVLCKSASVSPIPPGIRHFPWKIHADGEEEDEDLHVSVEEAALYLQYELDISTPRSQDLVRTVGAGDGLRVRSGELLQLHDVIKHIKETLVPRFQQYDVTGSGFVQPLEAVTILSSEFPGMPPSCLRSMVSRFDKDNNDQVDFAEFVEFYSCLKAKSDGLGKKFDELDVDGSGDLEAGELIRTLMEQCALPELQAHSLLADFDVNRDGRIDRQEFEHMWSLLVG